MLTPVVTGVAAIKSTDRAFDQKHQRQQRVKLKSFILCERLDWRIYASLQPVGATTGNKCQLDRLHLYVHLRIAWIWAPASVKMQSHSLRCDKTDRYAQSDLGAYFSFDQSLTRSRLEFVRPEYSGWYVRQRMQRRCWSSNYGGTSFQTGPSWRQVSLVYSLTTIHSDIMQVHS